MSKKQLVFLTVINCFPSPSFRNRRKAKNIYLNMRCGQGWMIILYGMNFFLLSTKSFYVCNTKAVFSSHIEPFTWGFTWFVDPYFARVAVNSGDVKSSCWIICIKTYLIRKSSLPDPSSETSSQTLFFLLCYRKYECKEV